MKILISIILLLFLTTSTASQEKPAPCSEAELRASLAEARLAAERVLLATCLKLEDEQKHEIASQKGQIEIEQKNSANLVAFSKTAQQRIAQLESIVAEQERTIAARNNANSKLTAELDKANYRIERTNHKWNCKLFRVGCVVGEK